MCSLSNKFCLIYHRWTSLLFSYVGIPVKISLNKKIAIEPTNNLFKFFNIIKPFEMDVKCF